MNRSLKILMGALLILVSLGSALAQEDDWPRTLPLNQGMVTIYRLQVDEMNDDTIHFRAALAYRATADSEPVFGAGWFESRVEIDQPRRIVHPTDLKVTETRFPEGTDDVQAELSAALAQQSSAWNLDFTLDELEASLRTAQAETSATQGLNTAPPRIIYRDHPALLVTLDGDPVLREIENSPYEAVINTPYPLIFDGSQYYLNVAKGVWYRAGRATGPYQYEARPPVDIESMVNAGESGAADEQPAEPVTAANAPEIVVTTEPAELIVTEGPAAFVPLVDDLLVLQNSEDDVFMHVSSQKFYIVLAGRWYQSSSLDGPWAYRPADDLPAAFANIPQDSDQADSRVYVAGTEEARDAVLDAQVPQTAAVQRGEVDIDVEYDGDPVYQPVDGTDLVYIENTGSTVLQSDGLYYLVEDGVWYVSSTPNGPWTVSTHRPAQVDNILPTSPVYNTKYVHVYDSTPNVVYVGYTPGYTGSYVYHNTLVYGSGWYYRPWISPRYYYPRYSTWGFHVNYNPWYGWNFGLSWGWGPFSVSFFSGGYWHHDHYWHHRHYGYWGPRGYRPRHHGHHGYGRNRYAHGGYGQGGYGRSGYGRNEGGGYPSDNYQRNSNLYRDGAQRARVADTRDKVPRMTGTGAGSAKYASANGKRGQEYAKKNRQGYQGAGPVSATDLRRKADVRDANYKASRNMLLADNSGKVYRKKLDRGSGSYDVISRRELSAKSMKNEVRPPRDSAQKLAKKDDRAINKSSDRSSGKSRDRNSVKNSNRSSIKSSSRGSDKSSSRTSDRSASRVSGKTSSQNRDKSRVRRTQQSPAIASPGQSKSRSAEKQVREPSSPAIKVPARKTQTRTVSNSTRQRPSQAARAPTQKQSRAQPGAQYKSSRNSGYSKAASAQRAPQRSTQKSSSQRKGSTGGGGKRAAESRAKGN